MSFSELYFPMCCIAPLIIIPLIHIELWTKNDYPRFSNLISNVSTVLMIITFPVSPLIVLPYMHWLGKRRNRSIQPAKITEYSTNNYSDYQWKFEYTYVVIIFLSISLLYSWTQCIKAANCAEQLEREIESVQSEYYDLGYSNGHKEGFEKGFAAGVKALKPVSMPESGTILSGEETKWKSEISVTASYGSSYVVSLKTVSGEERVSFFVRSGDTVTIGVPREKLYVYFACGDTWYGYGRGLMFGEDTVYSKDDELLDFSKYSWEYTLYPVTNGNFEESPSSEYEFF